ncbi:aldose 1-epimerase [Labedella gwakjiensis]|uniref:Aldose 1-epimerase n=1 Tax=Labedella gwakjiensis TaxID=390269 RepID=A0A2P8GVF1_9MICO|nr:aldose 1-epimerase family protein [Labedella gwakjiensis]PSL37948.1 aldose 1-epimerase [Labedella gwakjiensis]RUQ87486.1 galactose mutarotase [Labedella gwakjiensis]
MAANGTDARPISGEQFTIEADGYVARIASVGATLRVLTVDGRDLVVPFDADEVRPAFRGATLAPWPNRVTDGRYSFGDEDLLLSLTEPERGHALHGLAAWLDFSPVSVDASSVELSATIEAESGYPFRVRIDVTYRVSADGLETIVTATNVGPTRAPVGLGPHPYLVAGPGLVDDWDLELPASRVLTVEGERMIPGPVVGVEEIPGFDFRATRRIGDTAIDHAFADLTRSAADGDAVVRVTTDDGSGVGMRWGTACPWVQVHTADKPGLPVHRIGLAVEPMTCPPDAFNSGVDLDVVEPGEALTASWHIFGIDAR